MPDETTLRNAEERSALLADEAFDDNSDGQTRRETFELDLMARAGPAKAVRSTCRTRPNITSTDDRDRIAS